MFLVLLKAFQEHMQNFVAIGQKLQIKKKNNNGSTLSTAVDVVAIVIFLITTQFLTDCYNTSHVCLEYLQ